jgi:hypothetical protein
MSRPTSIEIVCPYCAAKNRTRVWLNLNSSSDQPQIEDALSGKLFELECRGCESDIPLEHSLHFHDQGNKRYYRFDGPAGGLQAKANDLEGVGLGYSLRRAGDFSSVLELMHIWSAGLDDGPMLLIKHMLAGEVQRFSGTAPLVCSFSHIDRSGDEATLEFVVIENEQSEAQNAGAPMRLYEDLVLRLKPLRDKVFPPGVWVDWDHVTAGQALEAIGK